MKRAISLIMTMAVGSALAADVTYTEPPADTSMIKVADGTTTVAGLEAYSHLTHYWSFDDENDPYADSVGNLPLQARKSGEPVWKTGENAKRGGAMWTGDGFRAATNFIDGKHPFTICFWYKYTTSTTVQGTLLYVGKRLPESESAVCPTPYLRLSHGTFGKMDRLYVWENQVGYEAGAQISAFTPDAWHHVALTCEVVEKEGCVTTNRYQSWMDGAKRTPISAPQNEFSESDLFLLGAGYHWQGGAKDVGNATFDEVMCFDRALTAAELSTFAAQCSPIDFSAGWDVWSGGALDILGREPLTALRGAGIVNLLEATRLESSSNAWFAGSISSPAFTFAGEAAVTQTLSGVNACAGPTTVESGTLEVSGSPVCLFGDALVAWYPFEDPSDPGRDFSPRGNNLKAETGFNWAVSPDTKSVLQIGNVMEVLETEKTNVGLVSSGRLNGFALDVDNSFTLACWMRSDKCYYRGGLFSFGNSSGFRRNGGDSSSYFGDTGSMIQPSGTIWSTGEWHHWTMVYDAAAAAAGETCYFLFKDGVLNKASDKKNTTFNHATQAFQIKSMSGGASAAGEYSHFVGALDEMIVLNTGNTNDVAKLYALRRTQPEAATDVLPTGTAVTVKEGATLKLTAANETVAQLYGKGTIDLSGNSKLTVTKKDRFEGTVIGGAITDAPGAERQGLLLLVR